MYQLNRRNLHYEGTLTSSEGGAINISSYAAVFHRLSNTVHDLTLNLHSTFPRLPLAGRMMKKMWRKMRARWITSKTRKNSRF